MPTKPPSKAFRAVSNDFAKGRARAGGPGAPANRTAQRVAAPAMKGMMGAKAGVKKQGPTKLKPPALKPPAVKPPSRRAY